MACAGVCAALAGGRAGDAVERSGAHAQAGDTGRALSGCTRTPTLERATVWRRVTPHRTAPHVRTRRAHASTRATPRATHRTRRLSGTVPFGNGAADENAIFRAIQTEELKFGAGWASITGAAKELIAGCLEKDPSKRYTVEQALDHPWVSGDAASDRPIDRSIVDALVAFNARNKFKKAAISLVASSLTAKDVQDMRAAFMRIDKDNSGTITHAELVNAMREMGMGDKADFRTLVESVDADKDGLVSWEVSVAAGRGGPGQPRHPPRPCARLVRRSSCTRRWRRRW